MKEFFKLFENKTIMLIFAISLYCISIFFILYFYDWKLLLILFLFSWAVKIETVLEFIEKIEEKIKERKKCI